MERERAIEFVIGLVVIIFIILLLAIFLNINKGNQNSNSKSASESGTTIINNYYYENSHNLPENYFSGNVVYKCDEDGCVVYKKYYDEDDDFSFYDWEEDYDHEHYDRFSSYKRHSRDYDGFNYVDTYSVFVKNRDYVGKYFKVIFYFEDECGLEESETMIKFIDSGEVEKFVYRDVHFERYNYENWDYGVFSQDYGFN